MAAVKVFHDRIGNTLVVWFGNPEDEYEAEETGDEVILMKDRNGKVIGFEKLNFMPSSSEPIRVAFETFAMQRIKVETEVILQQLRTLEDEIQADLDTLEGLLQMMLLAKSENLTPQPPSLVGKGEPNFSCFPPY